MTVIFKFAFSVKNFAKNVKTQLFSVRLSDCIPDPNVPIRYMLENIMTFIIIFSRKTYPHGTYFMCSVDIGKKSI